MIKDIKKILEKRLDLELFQTHYFNPRRVDHFDEFDISPYIDKIIEDIEKLLEERNVSTISKVDKNSTKYLVDQISNYCPYCKKNNLNCKCL